MPGVGSLEKGWREETRDRSSNWRTEEIQDAGNDKGVFFTCGDTVFKAQDLNVEWCTKVAATIQNAIQCYHVNYDEKKSTTAHTSLDHFFKRVDRIESNKEPETVSSTSGMSEIVVCLHLLFLKILRPCHLSPLLVPPASSSSCLFTGCQALCASYCTYYCTFLGTVL